MDAIAVQRRNGVLLVLEGTLFWTGLAFLQADTVISMFINDTTGSIALVGLAATLKTVMPMIGQFVMGMVIHRIKKQSRAIAILGFIDRPLILLMIPLLMMGMTGMSAAVMFLVVYSAMFLLDGAVGLLWTEICTRTMPIRRRGEVITLQQIFSGLAGFAVGLIVSRIIGSSLSFEYRYAIVFGLAGVMMVLDAVVLSQLGDLPHDSAPERPIPKLSHYIKQLVPHLKQDPQFGKLLVTRALYLLTLISAPLNLVFGQSMGHLSPDQVSMLIFMPVIGQTAAGVLWSQVCKRLGYPVMMLMAQVLGVLTALVNMLCFSMAMAGMNIMLPLSIAMILVALNVPAYTAYTQQMIAMAPAGKSPEYLVLCSVVLCPFAFGTYFAGLIAGRFGYLPVYLIMLISGLLGTVLVWQHFVRGKSAD